jgi:hypothetical protein
MFESITHGTVGKKSNSILDIELLKSFNQKII